ncbi:MAG: hypothetical protein ACRC62_23880 [Microcoleus sp.]
MISYDAIELGVFAATVTATLNYHMMTLLHQLQAVCCKHLSPVKDIKIFLQGTPIVSLYGIL